MRILLTLLRKDIANFRRNRAVVVITFVVPVTLIYIFGLVFRLNEKDTGPRGFRLAVIDASGSPAGQKLVAALEAESAFRIVTTFENPDHTKRPLTEADARALIHDREFDFALVIPRDVIPEKSIGLHLRILSNPQNDIETQTVNGLLQKTIFSHAPELLGESLRAQAKRVLGDARLQQFNHGLATTIGTAFGGNPDEIQRQIETADFGISQLRRSTPAGPLAASKPRDDGSLRRLDAPAPATPPAAAPAPPAAVSATPAPAPAATPDVVSRIIRLETEQIVGKDVKSPAATRVVGGWAIMFLLFAISGSSAAFFDEKNAGLFQRVLSAPVSRAQLLLSRFLWGIVLGLTQLTTLFVAGHVLYGIDVFGHLGNLLVICTAAAAACTSFGMFIAAFSPNAQAANGLSTFLVLVMSATGGAWFPIWLMPDFMQKIGKCTVVYWSMEGFGQVLWAGSTFRELLPTIGVLLAITAGVMTLSIWRLNRRNIFG